jgi:ribonuclease D
LNPAEIASLSSMPYEYIKDEVALADLCADLAKSSVITLDTEFVRTRTLNPLLGLLQVFNGERLALIDPVAIEDLSAFSEILTNTDIVKVLHSCSEDIDALHSNLGVTPQPLFDTQFAASILGIGPSIGYANLIETFFSITLDKGESRTDWMARPLSAKQLDYAAADVTYLMAAFHELESQLNEKGWRDIVLAESATLILKKTTMLPSEYAYLGLSNAWKLSGSQLYALKNLAQWRMDIAREQDIAINFVIKEAVMLDIAINLPQSAAQLHQMPNFFGKQVRLYSQAILDITADAMKISKEDTPPRAKRLMDFTAFKRASADIKSVVEKIESKTGIPAAVLASKKQIGQVLKWCWFEYDEFALQGLQPDILSGWRRALFIEELSTLFSDPEQQNQGKYETLRSL